MTIINTMLVYQNARAAIKKKPSMLMDLIDLHNLDIKSYDNIFVLDNMEFDNLDKILNYIYKKFGYIK